MQFRKSKISAVIDKITRANIIKWGIAKLLYLFISIDEAVLDVITHQVIFSHGILK